MRWLDQNASAVAGIGFATARAPVIQIQKHLQRLLNNGVRLPALDVDHEPHTAGFVLKTRIVKALPDRRTGPLRATAMALMLCSNRHVREMQIPKLTVTKVG